MSTETPMKLVVDCLTGEQSYVPLTEEELAQQELDRQEIESLEAAQAAETERLADLKASAKAKLVSGQPLTEEEASVLVI